MIRDEIIIKNCVVWNKGDGVDDETWNERPIEDALQQKYDLLLALWKYKNISAKII